MQTKNQKGVIVRKTGWPGIAGWTALAVIVLTLSYYLWARNNHPASSELTPSLPPSAVSGSAPLFTLTGIDGASHSLADLRGKVVVLDFWATWCPPCKQEIPDFISLQTQYGPRGVQIVGIGLDEPEKLAAFARQTGMNYPVLLGTQDVAMRYGGIEGIPTTFVIDKNGKIVNRFEGYRPREVFEQEIKQLLD
jgi:peroxiredoxin